jgi:hypothetical protein
VLTGLAVQVLVNPLKLLDKLVEALLEFFERLLPVGRWRRSDHDVCVAGILPAIRGRDALDTCGIRLRVQVDKPILTYFRLRGRLRKRIVHPQPPAYLSPELFHGHP